MLLFRLKQYVRCYNKDPFLSTVMTAYHIPFLRSITTTTFQPFRARERNRNYIIDTLHVRRLAVHSSYPSVQRNGTWSIEIGNPQSTPSKYNPFHTFSVVIDPDGYLTNTEASQIEQKIHSIKHVRIVAVIVTKIDNEGKTVDEYVRELHDRWGVGRNDKQNGVVVFISIDDRDVYISVGSGVKRILNNNELVTITKLMGKHLRINRYFEAFMSAIDIISGLFSSSVFSWGPFAFMAFLIAVVIFIEDGDNEPKQLLKAKTDLNSVYDCITLVIDEGGRYSPSACPHCLTTPLVAYSYANGYPLRCQHFLCTSCCSSIAGISGNIAACPVCQESPNDIELGGNFIATSAEEKQWRLQDLCYRVERLHRLHPTWFREEEKSRVVTALRLDNLSAAEQVIQDRSSAIDIRLKDIEDDRVRRAQERNAEWFKQTGRTAAGEATSSSSTPGDHFGGGASGGGVGGSF